MYRLWLTLFIIIPLFFATSNTGVLQAQAVVPGEDDGEPVETPLAVEPSTDQDRFETAILMSNLGRNDLAKAYLKQLVNGKLSDEALLNLRDEFGTVELVRLARTPELLPEAQQLLDQVAAASRRNAMNPERIDKVLADLDGSPRVREQAIVELEKLGLAAMPRLVQHLGSPNSNQTKDQIVYLFSRMGEEILPALMAGLDSDNTLLKTSLLDSIGVIGKPEDVRRLWYYAYSEQEAKVINQAARIAISRILYGTDKKASEVSAIGVAQELMKLAQEHLSGQQNWPTGEDGRTELWVWDAQQSTVIPVSVTPQSANLRSAVTFSRQALSFTPENPEAQALYLASLLSEEAYRVGPEGQLPTGNGSAFNLALTSSAPILEMTAEVCFKAGRSQAAEAVLRALSLVGDRHMLYTTLDNPSPVLKGLNTPDPRIQFAAAAAAVELNPETTFRSASRVVEILAQALNDDGTGKVLLIDPNIERGRSIAVATRMSQQIERTGKEGFMAAALQGDIALVMTHINCIDWELSQTLANFRADVRTAYLPIVIYGPTFMEDDLSLTIQRTPNTHYVVYTDERAELDRQLDPFLVSQNTPPMTNGLRDRRARAAASLLAQIATRNLTHIFNLKPATTALGSAVNDDVLASDSMTALSAIPTREAQDILVNVALGRTRSPQIRTEAALGLAKHMQRYGVLISDQDIAELKQQWEDSEEPTLQTALTVVVGSLGPNRAKVTDRLQSFEVSPLPVQ